MGTSDRDEQERVRGDAQQACEDASRMRDRCGELRAEDRARRARVMRAVERYEVELLVHSHRPTEGGAGRG
jgi:hypothetical protein